MEKKRTTKEKKEKHDNLDDNEKKQLKQFWKKGKFMCNSLDMA